MDDKFNVYDFFGIIIPGFAAAGLLYLLAAAFLQLAWPPPGVDSLGSVLGWSLAVYLLGYIVQSLDGLEAKQHRELLSKEVLADTTDGGERSKVYTPQFKERLHAWVEKDFGLDAKDPAQRGDVFRMCYAVYLRQQNPRAATFQALQRMAHSLAEVSRLGVWVAGAVSVLEGLLWRHLLRVPLPAFAWARLSSRSRWRSPAASVPASSRGNPASSTSRS